MRQWINKIKQRNLSEQRGAYTIEFLAILTSLLVLILIVAQVILSLLQGIVFNHALSLAAQQAAARGGSDASVVQTFESHLMPGMKVPSGQSSLSVFRISSSGDIPVGADAIRGNLYSSTGGNGREPTRFGEIFCVQGSYKPVAMTFFGGSNSVVNRKVTVSSQSSRSSTPESLTNQGCTE